MLLNFGPDKWTQRGVKEGEYVLSRRYDVMTLWRYDIMTIWRHDGQDVMFNVVGSAPHRTHFSFDVRTAQVQITKHRKVKPSGSTGCAEKALNENEFEIWMNLKWMKEIDFWHTKTILCTLKFVPGSIQREW